jgi:cytochrome c peroxidase
MALIGGVMSTPLPAQVGPVLDPDRLVQVMSFKSEAPAGLPLLIPTPPGSPMTQPAWELGRRLFSDPVLSSDRTVSCASCHVPNLAFSSRDPNPPGVAGKHALRHPPALLNRAYGKSFSWDGKAQTLEEQVLLPIENPDEMALPLDEALARVRENSEYPPMFREAFHSEVDRQGLAIALATFVRSLTLADSPFDDFRRGKIDTLTRLEKAGMWIFESKGSCWRCHTEPFFTDEAFHNTGVGVIDGEPEVGRMGITGANADRGKFKTPTLRGLTFTAPYMHDGSLNRLEEVVDFYRRGGGANRFLDSGIEPLDLTDSDVASLVAFLQALSRRAPPATGR